jgi:single-stranded DNA-binding protein
MLAILATGTLIADPVSRVSTTSGKSFTTAALMVPAENSEPMRVSVIAFAGDPVEALLLLKKGDACAISGRAKLSSWTKNGEEKHGLSVIADRVLSAYAAGKQRVKTAKQEALFDQS